MVPSGAAGKLLGWLLCSALIVQLTAQQPPIKMGSHLPAKSGNAQVGSLDSDMWGDDVLPRQPRLKTDETDPPSWRDDELSPAERTDALLSDLTLNEKVSLLQVSQPAIKRVGLPPYNFGRECERGDTSGRLGTAYPTGLALGGSFDVQLVHAIAVATAIEVRGNVNTDNATFGASCFGPVSNLVRDPRWGRAQEMVTGEDPQLGRIMSRAFTWGMQHRYDRSSNQRMLNTIAKHLNTYGGPEGTGFTFGSTAERFNFEAKISERAWREFFLPPFFGSAEANVSGYMCSYSSITFTDHPERSSNTPACANKYMLHDVVRGEWGWSGYILSDAGATAFVGKTQIGHPGSQWHESNKSFGHGFASSQQDAAVKALTAGLDLELTCCGAPAVFPTLNESITSGKLDEKVLDDSLRRTLPVRFELGQLDGKTPSALAGVPKGNAYARLNQDNVSTPQMIELALTAAKKAIVLLKNSKHTLPLQKRLLARKTVCMFGPNANSTSAQEAGYVPHPRHIITPFAGVVAALPDSTVKLIEGCNTTRCTKYDKDAVRTALNEGCDAFIAVVGLTAYSNPGSHLLPVSQEPSNACGCVVGDGVEGECCDRQDVEMPGEQLQLLQEIAAAATPVGKLVILVSINAGMIDLSWAKNAPSVGAIINAPYLGQMAGKALAATLLGESNPAGRLVTTWYRSLDDIGPITDYAMYPRQTKDGQRQGRTYRYFDRPVLWPFGFGLSYTSFEYSHSYSSAFLGTYSPCETVDIKAMLAMTDSDKDGGTAASSDEVVQVYITIHNSTVTTAKHQLVTFSRVTLTESMHTKALAFRLLPEDHAVLRDPDFAQTIEPGLRTVWVGGGQPGTAAKGVALTFSVAGSSSITVDECAAQPGGTGRAVRELVAGDTDAHLWSP